jgi:UMF1 family MFS transporter
METPARTIAVLFLSPLVLIPLVFYIIANAGIDVQWAFLACLGPIIMLGIFLWRKGRTLPQTARYLLSYLIFNDGIQTVIGVASVFAAAKITRGGLEMPTARLTLLVLMIQFVGFLGALFFGWLAGRLGTKRALVISLIIWAGTVIYAYFGMRNFDASPLRIPQAELEFWVLGACIALVLGGSQALSRSLFSQMIPPEKEAEFFSIYEISERGTSWMGPFLFAAVNQSLGNLRPAILSVVIFFVVGLVLLVGVNVKQAVREAQASAS